MKNLTTKIKGWRTVLTNILLSVIPVLELTEMTNIIPDKYLPFYALGIAVINVYLRSITTTPMGYNK